MQDNQFDLDTPLLEIIGEKGTSYWTARMACEGTQVVGGIGSGKSSSSAMLISMKFLQYGFGGLVLTSKISEKNLWMDYCRKTGRLNDLLIIEPSGAHRFNFLEYISSSSGSAFTANIVQVLKTVLSASEEQNGGQSNDAFWETALDMLLYNIIDVSILAYGKVTVRNLYDIVQTLPQKNETRTGDEFREGAFHLAFEAAKENVFRQIEKYAKIHGQRDSYDDVLPDVRLFMQIDAFFTETYLQLSEKTRSIITFSFAGLLFRLMREPIYSLFCQYASTFTPEDCLKGKIILLNLPVKEYYRAGQSCQILFKYIWQRSMERRDIARNGSPVFLIADEAQEFIHPEDSSFQATARSSRVCTLYICPNINNYYASMGGNKSEYKVKSFLGTLATKVFHANTDMETNRYASDLIGEDYFEESTNTVQITESASISQARTVKLQKVMRPEEFAGLKTGSPSNNYEVQAYMYRQGKCFVSGKSYEKVTFLQDY